MSYRILIADDDPMQRQLLVDHLQLLGFEVIEAWGGQSALACMATETPDLVLLDIQMPEIDGFEVLRRMRADARLRDVPVLLVSSIRSSPVKVRGLELGADDYITKPCPQAELLARVRAGLRRAARYRRLAHSVEGEIEDIGLDTLLQTLQIGGKTARIYFAELGAELVVGQGAIHSCRYLKTSGVEALQRLFLTVHGRFTADFDEKPVARGEASLSGIHALMDALVAADEARKILKDELRGNPVLDANPESLDIGELEPLREAFPMSATDLVVNMGGDIRHGMELVAAAVREGSLRVVG